MGRIFEKIYEEVKKIQKGQTSSYGEIARKAGTTPRVVGYALHRNPDPKNIPCHRVIFKDGRLSPGYVFGGEGKQRERLVEEGVVILETRRIGLRFDKVDLRSDKIGGSLQKNKF